MTYATAVFTTRVFYVGRSNELRLIKTTIHYISVAYCCRTPYGIHCGPKYLVNITEFLTRFNSWLFGSFWGPINRQNVAQLIHQ